MSEVKKIQGLLDLARLARHQICLILDRTSDLAQARRLADEADRLLDHIQGGLEGMKDEALKAGTR